MIGPAVGADRDMVAALVVPGIDQNIADTGCAQFAERDFLRVGRHDGPSSLSRAGTLAPFAGSVNPAWTARRIRSASHPCDISRWGAGGGSREDGRRAGGAAGSRRALIVRGRF
jgi:hypothetical protein